MSAWASAELAAFARHKTVPVHSQSFWYYWGGISLFLFLVQCFTGVLLLVYLPARRRGLRVGPPDHVRDALRLAHPLGARLVRQPDDLLHPGAHVLGLLHEGLPQAARVRLAQRHGAAGHGLGLRLLRLPAAHGRAELLRHQGRPADSRGDSLRSVRPSPTCCAAARMSANSPCSASSRCTSWCSLRSFFPCSDFISGWSSATATPLRPAKRPSRPPSARPCPSCPTSCARIWPCGSSRSTFWRCWPRSFPGRSGKAYDSLAPAPVGIHPEWYFMSPFEMLKLLGMRASRRGRRDRRHSALHARHRALGSDSLLRQRPRNPDSAPAPRTTSACWRFSRCWPPPSSATGRFGKAVKK